MAEVKNPPVINAAVESEPQYVSWNDASSQESDGLFLPLGQGGSHSPDMGLDDNIKE